MKIHQLFHGQNMGHQKKDSVQQKFMNMLQMKIVKYPDCRLTLKTVYTVSVAQLKCPKSILIGMYQKVGVVLTIVECDHIFKKFI
jgi:hypothetical protein